MLNCDVDEFWWPRDGSLRDVLEAVPPRFGTIRGWGRHFVARPETGEPFFERMTVRRRPTDAQGEPVPAGLQDGAPGDARRRRHAREPQRVRPGADAAPRMEALRGVPLPHPQPGTDGTEVPAPRDEPRRPPGLTPRAGDRAGDPGEDRRGRLLGVPRGRLGAGPASTTGRWSRTSGSATRCANPRYLGPCRLSPTMSRSPWTSPTFTLPTRRRALRRLDDLRRRLEAVER